MQCLNLLFFFLFIYACLQHCMVIILLLLYWRHKTHEDNNLYNKKIVQFYSLNKKLKEKKNILLQLSRLSVMVVMDLGTVCFQGWYCLRRRKSQYHPVCFHLCVRVRERLQGKCRGSCIFSKMKRKGRVHSKCHIKC